MCFDFVHERSESSTDAGSRPQNMEQVKFYFANYPLAVRKVLEVGSHDQPHVWRIIETVPEKWVSDSGRVVLAGDAAHAVLPYVGQVRNI
jgi:salicylate hydroxylase